MSQPPDNRQRISRLVISILFFTVGWVALIYANPHRIPSVAEVESPVEYRAVTVSWDDGSGFTPRQSDRRPGSQASVPLPQSSIRGLKVAATKPGTWDPTPPDLIWSSASGKHEFLDGPNQSVPPPSDRPTTIRAARFDGRESCIHFDRPIVAGHDERAYTLAFWFRRDDTGRRQQLLSQCSVESSGRAFFVGFTEQGNLCVSDSWQTEDLFPVRVGVWHHLAVSMDRVWCRVYLDGYPVASKHCHQDGVRYDVGGPLVIGRQGVYASEYFAGAIGQVTVCEPALSADEVTDLLNRPTNFPGTVVRCRRGDEIVDITGVATAIVEETVADDVLPRTGWWAWTDLPRSVTAEYDNRVFLFVQACASAILLTLFWAGVAIVGRVCRPDWRREWGRTATAIVAAFFICAAPSAVALATTWPGHWNNDTLGCWCQAHTGKWDDTHPYLYQLHIAVLIQFWDHPGVLPVFQIVAMAAAIGAAFGSAARLRTPMWMLAPAVVLSAFAPGLIGYNLFPQKDVLMSAGLLGWCVVLFHLYRIGRGVGVALTWRGAIALAVGLVLLSRIRHNGFIYLPVVFVALFSLRLVRGWSAVRLTTAVAAVAALLFVGLPKYLRVTPAAPHFFETMAMTNPVAALFQPRQSVDLSPAEVQRFERLTGMTAADFRAMYHAPDVNPIFYHPKFRHDLTDAEYAEFRSAFLRAMRRNPHVFFADRAAMFANTVINPNGVWYRDYDKDEYVRQLDRTAWGIEPTPVWPTAGVRVRAFFAASFRNKAVWWGSCLPLVVLVGVLAGWRRCPAAALAAALVLVQLPLLMLATPIGYFKYVHFLYCGPLVVLPLWAAEMAARRPGAVRPSFATAGVGWSVRVLLSKFRLRAVR